MKNLKLLLATTAILSMGAMAANATGGATGSATINANISIVPSLDIANGTINFGKISTFNPAGTGSVTVAVNHNGSLDDSNTNATMLANPSATPVRITSPVASLYSDTNTAYSAALAATDAAHEQVDIYMQQYHNYQHQQQTPPPSLIDNLNAARDNFSALEAVSSMYNDLLNNGYSSSSYGDWTAELSNTTFNMTSGDDTCGTVTLSTPKWTIVDGGEASYIDLSYSASFVLASGYKPSSETSCTGFTTLTIIQSVQ